MTVVEIGEGSELIDDGELGEFCDEMGQVNEGCGNIGKEEGS